MRLSLSRHRQPDGQQVLRPSEEIDLAIVERFRLPEMTRRVLEMTGVLPHLTHTPPRHGRRRLILLAAEREPPS
jgi:hypothetical protein